MKLLLKELKHILEVVAQYTLTLVVIHGTGQQLAHT